MGTKPARAVNSDVYDTLGERWYAAEDDPIALLRAESRLRNPWIAESITARLGPARRRVLDVGCGAGFLANFLSARGFDVTGIDASADSVAVAARHDATSRVRYDVGDALALPYAAGSFDAVCAMDFLEHVEDPGRVVAEAARVLAPGGLFFFHTFDRNPLAWLVVIKGVEWFVKNTPRDLHLLRLFVKPRELAAMCVQHGLRLGELRGMAPKVRSRPFWHMLTRGVVTPSFEFEFTRSVRIAYCGVAVRS